MGVFAELPPKTEPAGVDVEVEASGVPFTFAACFAAFSARRFCFEVEGGMMVDEGKEERRGGSSVQLSRVIDLVAQKFWRSMN